MLHHTETRVELSDSVKAPHVKVTVRKLCMEMPLFFFLVWLADHNLHQHHTKATVSRTVMEHKPFEVNLTTLFRRLVYGSVPVANCDV